MQMLSPMINFSINFLVNTSMTHILSRLDWEFPPSHP